MSSSTLRIIAILLAIGALVLGYMGYKASQAPLPVSQDSQQQAPEPERFPVLVAARDIASGQQLDSADVTTMFVESVPADSYDNIAQISGRQVRLPIAVGELVLKDHFHDFSPLVSSIRDGERAIAVRVDEVTGAGGFIEPGDSVDVLLFLASGREVGDKSSAQRILSDVRVLAYGDRVDNTDVDAIKRKAQLNKSPANNNEQTPDKTDDDDKASGKKSKTAVLAVAEHDLSALLLAESAGRLRLALIGKQIIEPSRSIAASQPSETSGSDGKLPDRQLVTLDQYKPTASSATKPVVQAVSRVVPVATPAKVTVHRGTQEATVSVDREN